MFNFLKPAEPENSFELPEIPENMILDVDKNYKETLILKIPVMLKNKKRFLYVKPPSFLKYGQFLKDLTRMLITNIIKNEGIDMIKDKQIKTLNLETDLKLLLKLIKSDIKPLKKILAKYFIFRPFEDGCNINSFFRNASPFQVQRLLVYILFLDTAVKKNEKFLNQKLGINKQRQISREQSVKKSDGKYPLPKPRF